jgi:hypothetical protein
MDGNCPVRRAFQHCCGYTTPRAGAGPGRRERTLVFAGCANGPILFERQRGRINRGPDGYAIVLAPNTRPPERGDMNSAPTDAQRPQVMQAAADRRSTSALDRKVRTSHQSRPRSRSVHVPQGKSISSPTAPATADDQQAEYFVRLLTQSRQRIEQLIDDHQRAIAVAESRGKTEDVRRYRQMTLIEEHDRRTVADLIDNLQQRFRSRAPGEVAQVARRVRRVL